MIQRFSLIIVACLQLSMLAQADNTEVARPELVDVQRIWDRAPHNAFTDLLRHDGVWYCVFREGSKHVSSDGSLRVITSADGKDWKSLALISHPTDDLRDAKLTVTPDGRIIAATRLYSPRARTSLSWIDPDKGTMTECLELPSGGDTSYPGMVWHEGLLWISYYSSQEEKTAIYLAKVKLSK